MTTKPKKKRRIWLWVLGAFVVLAALGQYGENSYTPEERARRDSLDAAIDSLEQVNRAREKYKEELDDAKGLLRFYAEESVKGSLKAPSTAKFCRYRDYRIQTHSDSLYTVYGFVDAQNSFGAMIRNNFSVSLRWKGGRNFAVIGKEIK